VGVITLAHNETGFFTPDHLALVQAIADQAGIAILNARLYADSQRQARVMTALADSAAAIAESLDLDDVLKRILEQISQVMQVEAISLALIDPQKDELVFHASIGWENVTEVHPRIRLGTSVVGWVARQGQGTVVADTGSDTRFDDETIHRTGIPAKAIACAPIRLQEQVIGVIEAINPVEGSFDGDALLVLTGIGSLAGTAIRHAQLFEQLQAAHQRYRELFEDSVDPILISDWEGHILEANRQAVIATGFDTEELRQMPVGRLHNVGEGILEQRFEGSSSGDTIFYESTLKTKDQKEVPIQVYVRQTLIDGVPHLQWILRDISERKRLDTVRDDLLAMVYHDLQSPLSNVLSSLELARSILPQSDDPTLKNLVGIALRSADRVQRLINSLLDTNRLEEGQPIGNRQPSQIADIIKEAIEVILPTLEAKHHKLERVLEEHLPLVRVDADMIRRVLINLLENAIKFSPSRSKIQVGASQKGEWVNVWVQDNGPGIPLADHERIFLKFTRLDYQNSPKGLGLGLAFCRLAIEGHGGRIWVESDIGKGARFTFTLPTNTE
jgi:PAS domain S-box-containing protein